MSQIYNKQYGFVAHGHCVFDWFFLELEVSSPNHQQTVAVSFSQEKDKIEQMEIQTSHVFIHATQPSPTPQHTLAFLGKIRKKTVAIKTTET